MHALVPVKSLHKAKSRLAKYLSSEEKNEVVLHMLDHVLTVLISSPIITEISVITPDILIAEYVKKFDVSVVSEEKSGYNQSLTQAARNEKKKEKLLTIPADLPLLTRHDIDELYELSQKNDIVLGPSKDNGTNAILMNIPLQLPYLFGKDSFEKYKSEALKRKITVGIYKSETLAFDIDTPEDVKTYKKIKEKDQF